MMLMSVYYLLFKNHVWFYFVPFWGTHTHTHLTQGHTIYSWLAWNFLHRLGWLHAHSDRSTFCICFLKTEKSFLLKALNYYSMYRNHIERQSPGASSSFPKRAVLSLHSLVLLLRLGLFSTILRNKMRNKNYGHLKVRTNYIPILMPNIKDSYNKLYTNIVLS